MKPKEIQIRNDKRIVVGLWKMLDEADIIIGHNAKNFDVKKSNTRFIANGLTPPSPYQIIDTLEVSKKHFAFTSNRLDFLGEFLEGKGKIKTDFKLWRDCDNGHADAIDTMQV